MIKEGLITLYLFIFRIVFLCCKLVPLRNKTVFLSSFGDNAFFIATELAHSNPQPLIFLNQKKCKIDFSTIPSDQKKIYSFESTNLLEQFVSCYHLATAKYVFIDNYAGFLSAVRFRKGVKCVQLWHAAGAIKKFGWSEPHTSSRSERAKKRFQRVYDQFQFLPVGSTQMADIFSEAFHLNSSRFLYTGVPQTDYYFDAHAIRSGQLKVEDAYPSIKGKKTVLYAPTYRKGLLQRMDLRFDVNEFLKKLDESHVLLIRLHPSVQKLAKVPSHPRVLFVSDYPHANELLAASDILITDYSSLSFEFSLLGKKMIFFTYDLEAYSTTQGIWSESKLFFPGPMATSTAEIIEHIQDPSIDFETIEKFRNHWNTFSTGESTKQVIAAVYGTKEK
ncbi:CDP-glycerol glycerophosphotransferase family protein [Planococcus sp. YIM B11945]|uniref:CDP-glycerol glycerophosphotransferase family protein n=1 Tax=Planococcus sp. YIM B11945 TaxID=3435410 RepID=UPI003D7C75D8